MKTRVLTMVSRILSLLVLLSVLLSLYPVRINAEDFLSENCGTIIVTVSGVGNDNGMVRCSLFDNEENFPKKGRSIARSNARLVNGTAIASFENIPFGIYAISLFHDENNNERLDRTFIGWPTETVGFSNDVPLRLPLPSWEDIIFEHSTSETKMHIRLRE